MRGAQLTARERPLDGEGGRRSRAGPLSAWRRARGASQRRVRRWMQVGEPGPLGRVAQESELQPLRHVAQ